MQGHINFSAVLIANSCICWICLNKRFQNGIIRPSQSPWRAQVVIVKSNNKKRLCVDYSQTVNLVTELDAYPIPNIEEIVHKLSKYSVFATYDLKSAYHQVPICEHDKSFTAFQAGDRLWEFNGISLWC